MECAREGSARDWYRGWRGAVCVGFQARWSWHLVFKIMGVDRPDEVLRFAFGGAQNVGTHDRHSLVRGPQGRPALWLAVAFAAIATVRFAAAVEFRST